MSTRSFNGSSDFATLSLGASPTDHPLTIAAILKVGRDGTTDCVLTAHNSSNLGAIDFQRHSSNTWVFEFQLTGFAFSTTTVTTSDGWVMVATTKASGTVAPRFHKYKYSDNSWVHEAMDTAIAGAGRTPAHWRVSNNEGGSFWQGEIKAAAVWNRALADADLEALPFSLLDWHASLPRCLWMFDQSATGQNIVDFTGGGANQSALTGTSVGTSSVPVFNYGIGAELSRHTVAAGGATPKNVFGKMLSGPFGGAI